MISDGRIGLYSCSGRASSSNSFAFVGCNLAVDVTWKYLNFFLSDDAKLKHIEAEYGSGRMLTGEAKAELIKVGSYAITHAVLLLPLEACSTCRM